MATFFILQKLSKFNWEWSEKEMLQEIKSVFSSEWELRGAALPLRMCELLIVTFLAVSVLGCNWFDSNNNRVEEPSLDSEPPSASFSASTQNGKAPLTISFTDSSSDGTSSITTWQWGFGDGNTSNDQNPQHNYNNAGTYSVSLSVSSNDGNDTETKVNYITVEEADVELKVTALNSKGVLLEGLEIETLDFQVESSQVESGSTKLNLRPASQDGVLRVSKDGYIDGFIFLEGLSVNMTKRLVLIAKPEPIIFDAFTGGQFFGEDGAGVEIPGESLRRADGTMATGDVELYIAPIDISDPIEVNAFPGSFYGTTALGEPQDQLFSYGVVDITFEQDGEVLQLADNTLANLTLPLYADKTYTDEDLVEGDTIPLWYLDEQTGLWLREGEGTVVANPAAHNGLSLAATTSHFTTFNSDINPPGLSRSGGGGNGGGSGGGSGNAEDHICELSIDLLGADIGERLSYTIVYYKPRWPSSSSQRDFVYDGSAITQVVLRGFVMTATVSNGEEEGATTFGCNGEAINRTITIGDQPPEITDFGLRVEPVFSPDADSLAEIIDNTVYIGGYWVGAEEAIISSPLLDTPMILGRSIFREVLYSLTDPTPMSFTARVSNEFGEAEATTQIEFITEHEPLLGVSTSWFDVNQQRTIISWLNVEGADTLDIYWLETAEETIGIKIGPTIELPLDRGQESLEGELGGYFRLDWSNRYGTTSELIEVGGADCPPDSELCVPES